MARQGAGKELPEALRFPSILTRSRLKIPRGTNHIKKRFVQFTYD